MEVSKMSDYIKFNQDRWDNVSRKKGNPYTLPLTPEEYFEAINNEIRVGLTVGKSVPRILKPGGLLMVGYMNPWIYMYEGDDVWDYPEKELLLKYSLPFNSRKLQKEGKITINPEYGYEFSHTLEKQIGGQLKAGFAMIDFYESKDIRNRLSKYSSDYLANLCIKL